MQSKLFQIRWLGLLFVLVALVGLGTAPMVVRANTLITVNSTDETINPTDGKCTLREAIISANTDTASGNVAGECPAGSGADTLELTAHATYTLSVVDNTDPTLGENGLPIIVSEIAVIGNGATIERSSADAIPEFRIAEVKGSGTLQLNSLTVSNGDSTADISTSVFTENSTQQNQIAGGGAVSIAGSGTIADSTFTGNAALLFGGALYSEGTVSVARSTFTGNSVSGSHGSGGGNLGSLKSNSAGAAKKGDALLGPLQDNGGSTKTMLPAPNSLALNAAIAGNCPATDGRGIARPQGARCDIGAVELQPPTLATLTNPANGKHFAKNVAPLKWQAGLRVASYKIVVRMNSRTGAKVATGTTTGLSFTTKAPATGHWYFWHVTSISNVGKVTTGWFKFFVQ